MEFVSLFLLNLRWALLVLEATSLLGCNGWIGRAVSPAMLSVICRKQIAIGEFAVPVETPYFRHLLNDTTRKAFLDVVEELGGGDAIKRLMQDTTFLSLFTLHLLVCVATLIVTLITNGSLLLMAIEIIYVLLLASTVRKAYRRVRPALDAFSAAAQRALEETRSAVSF